MLFIVGSPRSGTTLLQSLIATQNNVYSVPETFFFNFFNDKKADEVIDEQNFLKYILFLEKKLGSDFCVQLREVWSVGTDNSTKSLFLRLFERFYYIQNNSKIELNTDTILLEKTPAHLMNIKTIQECFPKSKFICIVRHPVHAILSRQKIWSRNKSRDTIFFAKEWFKWNSQFMSYQQKNNRFFYYLKYEDLISNVPEAIKAITTFLGISYNESNLSLYNEKVKSLYTIKEDKWKKGNTRTIRKSDKQLDCKTLFSIKLFLIQFYTSALIRKFNMKTYNNKLQRVFNLFFKVLIRLR